MPADNGEPLLKTKKHKKRENPEQKVQPNGFLRPAGFDDLKPPIQRLDQQHHRLNQEHVSEVEEDSAFVDDMIEKARQKRKPLSSNQVDSITDLPKKRKKKRDTKTD